MMRLKTRRRFVAGISALAMSVGLAVAGTLPATAATLSPEVGKQGAVGILSVWQEDYYHNYFNSISSCQNRGYAMINYEHIAGMLAYYCHLHPSESKWSMDIQWAT